MPPTIADSVERRVREATDDALVAMWWANVRRIEETNAGVAVVARNYVRQEMARRGVAPPH